jgi:hypothetical protein
METIIMFYIICILCSILITIIYVYPSFFSEKITEGNSNKNEDTCEYKLQVSGLIRHIKSPSLRVFGVNVLAPISGIVDMINEIIKIINKIIIAIDFFINKFIKCILFYILDGFGMGMWGICILFCKIVKKIINIDLESFLRKTYTFLDDNVDDNLYKFTGLHLMHFPTIIQNRCYHIFGDGRIPCWKNPFASNKKEGAVGVSGNSEQNTLFYKLLIKILGFLVVCLFVYLIVAWIMTFFIPAIKCEGPSCP